MSTRIFGSGIKRREDPRLITGKALYTDDMVLPRTLHMAVVRSPHAHARIKSIDIRAAKDAPGVMAVFTGQDLDCEPVPCAWLVPDADLKTPDHPALAKKRVRYVGDGVAVVLAESRYQAEDAAELVEVEYKPLDAVVDPEKATQEGAPRLYGGVPNNIAFRWVASSGDEEVEKAFEEADVVVSERIVQQRLLPTAMEPRAAMAQYNDASGEMTVWCTSQNPHIHRHAMGLVLGIPDNKLRVVAEEVGGGFGSKIPVYADEILVAWAARKLGRPVKWTETRSENYQATIHGRDHVEYVDLAAKKDGTMVAIRGKVYAAMGGYLSTAGPGVPTILHGLMYCNVYRFEHARCESIGVFTTTTPTDAYRGAGRPEAIFLVERLVDKLAAELEMDPVELRRKNLIPPFQDGYDVATGLTYDSGNYQAVLDQALEMAGYEDLRQEQEQARQDGRLLGVGVTTYAEICGLGPSQVAGATGFQGGLWESCIVRVSATGKVQVMIGTNPHGQGEETTFAQIVSDELGFPVEDIEVVHGDTDQTPMGWGTYGSRTTPVSGAALALAARKVKDKCKALAAHLLEAAQEDIAYEDGKFFVKGSPEEHKTIQDLALMATVAWDLPEGMDPGLEASQFYDPPNFVYPFGCHLAVVEVDRETGHVELKRYIAVDDCGPQINPVIVAGQVHGGVVQGVGQTLYEGAAYDEQGQLITGSMMDYTVPRADMFPNFELGHTETPSPHHPLGVKGIGETGTIASTVTVYNAVIDALRPLGVEQIEMPMTPPRVWKAIQEAKANNVTRKQS
ncbi:MAG TPA: molybdopterin cofactor-binding domain-containing protein [Acidobacteriota bacterium]|nr:molybdopterin cofactor-binding domain-containing protein [Acidobacteriota bacterium]